MNDTFVDGWIAAMLVMFGVELLFLIGRSAWRAFHSALDEDMTRRLQADAAAWVRDSAGATTGSESQPALTPSTVPSAGTRAAHSENSHPLGEPLPGGPGPQTPVGDRDPRLQSPTGPHSPTGEGMGKAEVAASAACAVVGAAQAQTSAGSAADSGAAGKGVPAAPTRSAA